jgi:hypothetical protein
MAKMSIDSHDPSGWLTVRMRNSTLVESLPDCLQVEFEGTRVNISPTVMSSRSTTEFRGLQTGRVYILGKIVPGVGNYYHPGDPEGTERDFFTILEGPHEGKKAFVKTRGSGSWFQPARPNGSAHLIFEMETDGSDGLTWGTLSFSGGNVKAFTETDEMPTQGTHDLRIPDAPHKGGRDYLGSCKKPMTWFRIGNNGDRYVHPGTGTRGCITVPLEHWDRVYDYLINARKGDLQTVGTV